MSPVRVILSCLVTILSLVQCICVKKDVRPNANYNCFCISNILFFVSFLYQSSRVSYESTAKELFFQQKFEMLFFGFLSSWLIFGFFILSIFSGYAALAELLASRASCPIHAFVAFPNPFFQFFFIAVRQSQSPHY